MMAVAGLVWLHHRTKRIIINNFGGINLAKISWNGLNLEMCFSVKFYHVPII